MNFCSLIELNGIHERSDLIKIMKFIVIYLSNKIQNN